MTKDFIAEKMATDDRWLERGILAIWKFQTKQEKSVEATLLYNGVGFNGVDGKFMTSLGTQIAEKISRGYCSGECLSVKQKYHARKRMKKYAGQLLRIANEGGNNRGQI